MHLVFGPWPGYSCTASRREGGIAIRFFACREEKPLSYTPWGERVKKLRDKISFSGPGLSLRFHASNRTIELPPSNQTLQGSDTKSRIVSNRPYRLSCLTIERIWAVKSVTEAGGQLSVNPTKCRWPKTSDCGQFKCLDFGSCKSHELGTRVDVVFGQACPERWRQPS